MICKHCGTENGNKSRFCNSCAMPLEQGSNNVVCSNCGSENNITAKFCGNCAKSLNSNQPNTKQPTQSRQQTTKVQGRKQNEVINKKLLYKRVWFWFMFLLCMLYGITDVAINKSLETRVTQVEEKIQKEVDKEIGSVIVELEKIEGEKEVIKEQDVIQEPKYVITVDKLMEDLNSNALKASNTYKGEYIELTGKLSTIDSSGCYFALGELNNDWAFITVLCRINEEHLGVVMELKEDQRVTVTGTITDVGGVLGYTLKVDKIIVE